MLQKHLYQRKHLFVVLLGLENNLVPGTSAFTGRDYHFLNRGDYVNSRGKPLENGGPFAR